MIISNQRSLLKSLCYLYGNLLKCIKFIQNIIVPPNIINNFIYQIVSNSQNGLDVDKYDYITRDMYVMNIKNGFDFSRLVEHILIIDGNICFLHQSLYEIYNMFHTRHRLHKTIYSHKTIIATQIMLTDALKCMNDVINLEDSILDMDKFVQFTDTYILSAIEILNIENAKQIIDRITTRNLYKLVATLITSEHLNIQFKLDDNNTIIYQSKIGFVSGDKPNPLDHIYIYKRSADTITSSLIKKEEITHIIPNLHQEFITMIFVKDKSTKETVKNQFINYMTINMPELLNNITYNN